MRQNLTNPSKGKQKMYIIKFSYFTLRYVENVMSLINPSFSERFHLIYPGEHSIRCTTENKQSDSYNDLYPINSMTDRKLQNKI